MTSVFGMLIWNGSCDIPSNVIIQRINFYDIKIQLMMVGIDNQYVYYLFSVIYIHKKNHILCYNSHIRMDLVI